MGNRHKDHTSGMWMNAAQILPAVRYRFIRDMVREQEKKEQEGAGPLSLLKQEAPAAKELISYVEAVAKEGGKLLIKNLQMNKVSGIAHEIGLQPVLCFGNSPGDSSMANYVTSGNRYRTGVYMVLCDDLERERGNLQKAEKMAALCRQYGWTAISMKNDWRTIYGDGVSKKEYA